MGQRNIEAGIVEPPDAPSRDGAVEKIVRPWDEPPGAGQAIEVADGILWMRLPLPLRLNHVNVYALCDRDGWTIVDAGYGNDETFAAWERLLTGPLGAQPVRRLIVTHFHPDHVGAAGWLMRRTGAELVMTRGEFLLTLLRKGGATPGSRELETEFFRRHGAGPDILRSIASREARFLAAVTHVPPQARILTDGDILENGGRNWEVATGGGHSAEQILLNCRAEGLLLSADHLIDKISPNIPLTYIEPHDDPVACYLAVLKRLHGLATPTTLVLPGHKLPFYGARTRVLELIAHHHNTLEIILKACAEKPRQATDLIETVYERSFGADGQALALSEILAHLAHLRHAGKLHEDIRRDGQIFFRI
jgi:glyoxylase-like metal-dependent hydrolase (beta-lactamase superfamily II)